MKQYPDGTLEGTPEELAAYYRAVLHHAGEDKKTYPEVPTVHPFPLPIPTAPDPWSPPSPPSFPWGTVQNRPCAECQSKRQRGETVVCECVLPDQDFVLSNTNSGGNSHD